MTPDLVKTRPMSRAATPDWREVRLVVFDLDGTLIDSLGDIALAVNRALARLLSGTPPLSVEQVRSFVGHGARHLMARSIEAAGIDRSLDEAMEVLGETYRESMLETTRLYPGVRQTLEALGAHRVGVLTNKPGDISRAILAGLGIDHYFERVLGGGDGMAHKPDPRGLQLLMASCHAAPDETIIVGDSAVDVQTGRAAGAHTAGVAYGLSPEDFVRHPPEVILPGLPELLPLLGVASC